MREGVVYINNRVSGILTEKSPSEYIFRYDDAYFADKEAPEISLSLPKKQQEYRSDYLFSFFFEYAFGGAQQNGSSKASWGGSG